MKKRVILLSLFFGLFSSLASADDKAILKTMNKLGILGEEIHPSPVVGLQMVLTDSGVFYVSSDGRYVLHGNMYDTEGNVPANITTQMLMKKKLEPLVPEMIVYPAKKEKFVVTVFTDITCGYCVKLHQQMEDYNKHGITMRYLAFPRQGLDSQAEKNMQSVWCSADKAKAFDDAVTGKKVPAASCKIDIADHYKLGIQFGVKGTPAMVLSDGMVLPGYQDPESLLEFLQAHQESKTQKN